MDIAQKIVIKIPLPESCGIYKPLHLSCAEGISIYKVPQYLIIFNYLWGITNLFHHFQSEENETQKRLKDLPKVI